MATQSWTLGASVAAPLRVGADGTAQLLQGRDWRWDQRGRVSARVALHVPDIAISIPSRAVGAAIAGRIQAEIRRLLDAGQDAAGAMLPDIQPQTYKRRYRRARQFAGAGAASWKGTAAERRRVAMAWAGAAGLRGREARMEARALVGTHSADDRWLVDRFQAVAGDRRTYAPDGGERPGRESGYLAGQVVVRFRGGVSGEPRFGIWFPSFKGGAGGGYYGRAAYISWAESRGARIVTVPPQMDREVADVLREFSGLMPDARRFRLRIGHLLRGLGIAEQASRWVFGG